MSLIAHEAETEARRRIRLSFETTTIEVDASDPAMLAWLTEFLAPAFLTAPTGTDAADHVVTVWTDPQMHARLRSELGSATLQDFDGFTLDGSFAQFQGTIQDDGRTWFHHDNYDTFYGVDERARSVIVAMAGRAVRPRLAVMRVVRELATIAQHRAGRLPIHGSAFTLDGTTVLICGPKRSGKTTLLIHALHGGASFVSNDRVFIDTAASPIAHAMPTITILRNGSLDMFPKLKAAFEHARFESTRSIDECAPSVDRPDPHIRKGYERPGITPAQFCRLLGTSMQAAGPVSMLLFPSIEPSVSGVVLEPLSPARALENMHRSLLKPSHPTRFSQVFAPHLHGEEIPPDAETDRSRRLVSQVPCFTCRLGPDAYARDLGDVLRRASASNSDGGRLATA